MNIKKVLISLSLFLAVFCVRDSSLPIIHAEDQVRSMSYLLKDKDDTEKVKGILSDMYPNAKLQISEQIGLLSVSVEGTSHNLNLQSIDNAIGSFIELSGNMPELMTPSPSVSKDIDIMDILKENSTNMKGYAEQPELNSPFFTPYNWYLERVTKNYMVHNIQNGEGIKIGLIDSGVDINHPLLKENINADLAKNYVENSLNIVDEQGHGTQVAGILINLAPESEIIPYKVLGVSSGKSHWVIQAIIDATDDNVDIINFSLGAHLSKLDKDNKILIKAYDRAIKYAKQQGVVLVASAGNSSLNLDELKKEKIFYLPAGLQHVITVSSNTKRDTLATYSNYGKGIDFSAPGGDLDFENDLIITTYPINISNTFIDQILGIPQGYTVNMGTSLSAPQVSAAAALLIAEYKDKKGKSPNTNQIEKMLKEGSIDIGEAGKDIYFGNGEINIYNSLRSIK